MFLNQLGKFYLLQLMINDNISDMISRIKNGTRARLSSIAVKKTKLTIIILQILYKNGYLRGYQVNPMNDLIIVELKYIKNKSVIQNFRRVSKSGRRIYISSKALYKLNLPIGFFILSTSKGILTSSDAKLKFVGGEVLCHIL